MRNSSRRRNRVCTDKGKPVVRNQPIDFIKLFFVSRQPRTNDDFTAEAEFEPSAARRALRRNESHTGHFSTAQSKAKASSAEQSRSRLALCDCKPRKNALSVTAMRDYFARRNSLILLENIHTQCGMLSTNFTACDGSREEDKRGQRLAARQFHRFERAGYGPDARPRKPRFARRGESIRPARVARNMQNLRRPSSPAAVRLSASLRSCT